MSVWGIGFSGIGDWGLATGDWRSGVCRSSTCHLPLATCNFYPANSAANSTKSCAIRDRRLGECCPQNIGYRPSA
ncbi:MAG: hypothetical protein DWI57_04930 [Chloroflexi bacterium]|nr:MAG: hypothetical protein DWI57_04930 [Chloroflexota bacterium]